MLLLLLVAITFINAKLVIKRWRQLKEDFNDEGSANEEEESEFDHGWLSMMEERMSDRSDRVGRMCHKVKSEKHWGGQKGWTERSPDLLLDEGRKVAYCRHGKVGVVVVVFVIV